MQTYSTVQKPLGTCKGQRKVTTTSKNSEIKNISTLQNTTMCSKCVSASEHLLQSDTETRTLTLASYFAVNPSSLLFSCNMLLSLPTIETFSKYAIIFWKKKVYAWKSESMVTDWRCGIISITNFWTETDRVPRLLHRTVWYDVRETAKLCAER